MNKIKEKIKKINNFLDKYDLIKTSSSIAFYFIISITSIFVILLGFITYFSSYFKGFLINDIVELLGDTFEGLVNQTINRINLNGISIFLIIGIIYSSSSVINDLTRFTDQVYKEYDKRSYIRTRFNSILIFLLLIFIVIIELIIILYSSIFLENVLNIKSRFLRLIINFGLEVSSIFLTISILYVYLPPKKMYFKQVIKTSIIIALIIYLLLFLSRLIISFIKRISIVSAITYIISIFGFLLLAIIISFIIGIIIIYQKNE